MIIAARTVFLTTIAPCNRSRIAVCLFKCAERDFSDRQEVAVVAADDESCMLGAYHNEQSMGGQGKHPATAGDDGIRETKSRSSSIRPSMSGSF